MRNRMAARAAAALLILAASTVVAGCAQVDVAVDRGLSSKAPGGQSAVEPPAEPSPVEAETNVPVSYTHLTLPTKRIV